MGAALENERGLQPIYLRYNSGRHVADNGAELAALLEAQLGPGAAGEPPLHIVAHSMGGLLARSAIEQARRSGMQWPHRVQHLVCLGTPHHGAPLERAGNWVDAILGALPFAAPIGRLAQLRSAGITDLRHGLVLPEDLPAAATPASGPKAQAKPGKDRFSKTPDTRTPLPLPAGMACHTVAATTAARRSALAERLLGDGLVPLRSALGQHPQIAHRLAFSEANQRVFFGMNHFELLQHPEVVAQVVAWLQPEPNAA
jgi:pimeloyl-ACP methyl ester carboxylesterase